MDTPHLFACREHLPPHSLSVFVPLCDLRPANGPTEFHLASHIKAADALAESLLRLAPHVNSARPAQSGTTRAVTRTPLLAHSAPRTNAGLHSHSRTRLHPGLARTGFRAHTLRREAAQPCRLGHHGDASPSPNPHPPTGQPGPPAEPCGRLLPRRLVRAVRPEGDAPRRGERERGGAGTRLPHPLPRLVQRHAQPVTNRGGPLAFCSARAQTKRLSFAVLARDRYSYSEDGARPVTTEARGTTHSIIPRSSASTNVVVRRVAWSSAFHE
mmetsp:Transcript_32482/g.107404  ORF Transcript_32482/g.107404 Transcript_32482/m.107404 type:complete len:270 (-) Transcript_32482:504-1313(-)